MQVKTKWPWKFYFIASLFVGTMNLASLFLQDSTIDQYYRILIVFRKSYWVWYSFHIASFVVETLSLIPLFLFVFHKHFLTPWVWRVFLVIRLALFFLGQHYETKMVQSFFHANPGVTIAAIGVIFFLLLPSYIAHFHCAFPKKQAP